MRELEFLAWDLADFRRVAGDAGRIDLAAVLWLSWLRIPRQDRGRLRGRFSLRIVPGAGARVGVPVTSAAVGRAEIRLGADARDFMIGFVHELAHVLLGHVGGPLSAAASSVNLSEIGAAGVAVLRAAGWQDRPALSDDEKAKEAAAWRQVEKWGFVVPGSSRP